MSATGLLGRWFADPLSPSQARQLLAQAEAREAVLRRRGGRCRCCGLMRLIAQSWLDRPSAEPFRDLLVRAHQRRTSALTELIYGQLLAARRLEGGNRHLRRGFELASPLLAPADYFQLLERHRRLALLPEAPQPAPAEPLATQLTAAAVMERLRGPQRPTIRHDPNDTYG